MFALYISDENVDFKSILYTLNLQCATYLLDEKNYRRTTLGYLAKSTFWSRCILLVSHKTIYSRMDKRIKLIKVICSINHCWLRESIKPLLCDKLNPCSSVLKIFSRGKRENWQYIVARLSNPLDFFPNPKFYCSWSIVTWVSYFLPRNFTVVDYVYD